ncbi:MAG: family 10 glycosylhydrolase [Phycisphaerae bacterium]
MRSAVLTIIALAAATTSAAEDAAETIDACVYSGAAAAGKVWRPMRGSPEAEPAEVAGRRCLRLPCAFAGTDIERASWDRHGPVDLADRRGVRFKMYIDDPSPVGHFTMYFHSGDGWYAAGFAPEARGRWHTVTVEKRDTKIEGRPAGWGRVDIIRLSAWRGRDEDTVLHVADLEAFGRPAAVLVVRAESRIRADAGGDGFARYARQTAEMFEAAGLRTAVTSDLDLDADRLTGRRLLVLPYNPSLPEAAAKTVAAWLDGGGKLLAFYTMPGALVEATGIAGGRHVRQKARGHFAEIRFGDSAPAGVPPRVEQGSWNVVDARPAGRGARVVARWFSADGRETGLPAVIASDRCIFMTHVLLEDDAARKRRMLLALAGHLAPGLWEEAAGGAVARIGEIGPYETFEAASGGIRATAEAAGRPQALAALKEAAARRDAARRLIRQEAFPEAVDAATEARRLLVRARCLAQPSEKGEFRALWCHSAFGPSEQSWDEEIRLLAENGFTAIVPNMLWADLAYYRSEVLPVAPEVAEQGDQVAACAAACRKHGVQCHVWKVNWRMRGSSPRAFRDRMRREGRLQVSFGGETDPRWLCPSHPANRKLEIESMVEVGTKYDVAGIHFDYIRYPNNQHCFCDGCRRRFEETIGRKVARWPKDVREDEALRAKWLDFRRAQITAVVEEVHRRVKKVRPECDISAAVFRNWPVHRDQVGQDWKAWCDRGLLDFVCPMDYTPSNMQFDSEVAQQVRWAGKVPCYPGIGLSTWPDTTDVSRVIDQVRITRKHKTGGFTIFQYGKAQMESVVPLCGLGLTKP